MIPSRPEPQPRGRFGSLVVSLAGEHSLTKLGQLAEGDGVLDVWHYYKVELPARDCYRIMTKEGMSVRRRGSNLAVGLLMLSSQLCGAEPVSRSVVGNFTCQRPNYFSVLPRYKVRRNSIKEGWSFQCLCCCGCSATSHLASAFASISRSISA